MHTSQNSRVITKSSLSCWFNIFGLVSVYTQWMWVVVVCLPSLLASDVLQNNTPEGAATQQSIASDMVSRLGIFQAVVGVIIIVLTAVLAVYAIKRSPKIMHTATEKVIDSTTDYILPVVTHNKKVSKKKHLQLTLRIQFLIKMVVSLLAFIVLPFTALLPVRPIDMVMTLAIGLVLLPWSLIWFTLARVLRIEPTKIHD